MQSTTPEGPSQEGPTNQPPSCQEGLTNLPPVVKKSCVPLSGISFPHSYRAVSMTFA